MIVRSKKFVTKPIEVEAYQWDGTTAEMHFVIGWVINKGGTAWVQDGKPSQGHDLIRLETKDGNALVLHKDWIVYEPASNGFRLVKPAVFDEIYEAAPQDIKENI